MQLPTLTSFAPPGRNAAQGVRVCVFGSQTAKIMAAIKLFFLRAACTLGGGEADLQR